MAIMCNNELNRLGGISEATYFSSISFNSPLSDCSSILNCTCHLVVPYNKMLDLPRKLFITSMLDGLINNPLKAITYLLIYAYCKAVAVFTRTTSEYDLWEISTSTKTLNTGVKGPD